MKMRILLSVAGVLAAIAPVLGHHAFGGEFDPNKPVLLKGPVTKVEWVSPHTWIYLDVKGTDGSVVNWAVEASSPGVLASRGWRRSTVLPGMFITIDAFLAKDGSPMVNGRDLTFWTGGSSVRTFPVAAAEGRGEIPGRLTS